MINILKYLLLGIIQGLTEPLPISSSGHLVIFKELFNANIFSDLNFEIFLNFASFIAIFIIFFKDIKKICIDFFTYIFNKKTRTKTKSNYKYAWLIVISSIPVAIIGLLFKDYIETKLSQPLIIGVSFLFTASTLFLIRKIKGNKEATDITYKDALIIGLIQCIALLPGVSRSGMCLVGCLLCNLKREESLKYTFMLYFPVSVGSLLLGIIDLLHTDITSLLLPYIIGMIGAGIVTYFTYQLLSNIVKKGKLWYFSIYCTILAIFVLIYFR